MKKILLIYAFLALLCRPVAVGAEVTWEEIGRGDNDVKSVLVGPENSRLIYIGSGRAVLKSEDNGENWRSMLALRGRSNAAHLLSFDPRDKGVIYAATASGLFRSDNEGRSWSRIFRGRNYLESDCTSIAFLPSVIYLGTKGGLFVSRDKGRSWQKESGKLGNADIMVVAYSSEDKSVYTASSDGVYRMAPDGGKWERVFVGFSAKESSDAEEPDEEQNGENKEDINYLCVDQNNGEVYLATRRGVYKTGDKGQNWSAVSDYGLLSRKVKFIFVSRDSQIYAVTSSGIFTYTDARWQELSFALAGGEVRSVSLDREGNLYAACEKGLFKSSAPCFDNNKNLDPISLVNKGEPQVAEIQKAAIKYAQVVDPARIESLRRQARLKAVLPELSLDYDKTVTSYSNATATRFAVGPPEWSVSLQWKLSDIIWSEQQRLIDSQARLMVELRNDIVDEVTKLYFERLRVKMELDNLSIEERKKRQEKQLRLDELTASLDGMTGGYFSRPLK